MRSSTCACVLLAACSSDPSPAPTPNFHEVVRLSQDRGSEEDGAVDLVFLPDRSGGYFVLYRSGLIEERDAGNLVVTTRQVQVRKHNECGALAIELDPGFAQNQLMYLGYCVVGGDVELVSFRWKDGEPTLILKWEKGSNDYHNLGDLGWDGDHLWLTYGDGNRLDTSQDPMDLRGKLLRIDPHRDGTPGYSIPTDNPHLGDDGVADEVIAWGLKSVFRADLANGVWFLANVGVDGWEHVALATLDGPGRNLGHPLCEGPVRLDQSNYQPTADPCDLPRRDFLEPVLAYPHDKTHPVVTEDRDAVPSIDSFAITGGVLYRGAAYGGALQGWYLYADNQQGFVRRARFESGRLIDDRHFGHVDAIWAFAVGPDDFVYALTPERLYRLERADP